MRKEWGGPTQEANCFVGNVLEECFLGGVATSASFGLFFVPCEEL